MKSPWSLPVTIVLATLAMIAIAAISIAAVIEEGK